LIDLSGVTLWEIIEHSIPYFHLTNSEVAKEVCDGMRLPKPSKMELSDEFHNLLQSCWNDHQTRPSFKDLSIVFEGWLAPTEVSLPPLTSRDGRELYYDQIKSAYFN